MSIQETKALKQFESLLEEVIALQVKRKDYLDKGQDLHETSRQKFVEAVEILRGIGMGDFEISELTREVLRNKIPKSSLKLYLSELKIEESTSESGQNSEFGQNDDNNDTEQESTSEIIVTTEGSQTTELERDPIIQATAPEEIKQLANEIPLEEYKSDLIDPLSEEDPKDLEIAFLKEKVSELEDALKKTQQFQPATALESQPSVPIDAILYQDEILKLLQKQADGVHSFFYDAYGIDLFKNRELAQLKNSGVKVFRRLYFEV